MDGIAAWLNSLKLETLIDVFEQQQIDLEAAQELSEADLRELDIPMGPRKKLLRAIEAFKSADTDSHQVSGQPAPDAASEGQNRQVTVLFADVTGFTELSARLDAEEVHSLLEVYFEKTDEIVRLHGGTVDKHIGDSVMAVFGAPVARGNEAERALLTALSIHRSMPEISVQTGHELTAHIGVASGQVVADKIGSDRKFTVTGESVNLASRLTDQAKAGETLISENVQRALPASTSVYEARTFQLKGFDQPVNAYLIDDASSQLPAAHDKTPLIGRARELAQFRVMLDECRSADRGQFVVLRGEAGIGKTRLCLEFADIAIASGFEFHRALVLDFGAALGQDAIRALTLSVLGLAPEADDTDCHKSVQKAVNSGAIDDDHVMHLNALLGLPQPERTRVIYDALNSDLRRQGKRNALSMIINSIARNRPQLLLIEDVHWAEETALETIAAIGRASVDCSICLVTTTRLEGDPSQVLQRFGLGSIGLNTMDLRSLRPQEARELAVGVSGTNQDLIELCIERAEGNPLFLEQLLRNSSSTSFDAVPDTVQSLVQASLDSLDLKDREALQLASAMGQRFEIHDVQNIIDDDNYDPSNLIARNLVQHDGSYFLFSHALVREGVYASILPSRCREFHARIADVIGSRDLQLRAQHLELAGDPGAAEAYLIAAREARNSTQEEAALKLCKQGSKLEIDAQTNNEFLRLRGDALLVLGRTENSIAAFRDALAGSKSDAEKCHALIGLAEGLRVASQYEEAISVLEQAESSMSEMPELIKARIRYLQGSVMFPLGNIDGCRQNHEESLKHAKLAQNAEAEASALSGLGDAHYLRGLMKDAHDRFVQCVEISRKSDLRRLEVANRHMVGWSRIHLMEFREALDGALASAELAASAGNRRAEVSARQLSGYASFKLGDYVQAKSGTTAAINLAEEIGAEIFSITSLAIRAQTLKAMEKYDDARAAITDAVGRLEHTGQSFIGPTVFAVAASLEPNRSERVRLLSRAETILDEGCVSHNYMWCTDVAIEIAYEDQDWEALDRYAARLRSYTKDQPLGFADFLIEKASALAKLVEGNCGPDFVEKTMALEHTAKLAELKPEVLFLKKIRQSVS